MSTNNGVQAEMTLNAVQKALFWAQFFDPDLPANADKDWPITLARPKHLRAEQALAKYESHTL